MEPLFREQFMRTISGVGGSLTRAKPEAVAEIAIPLPPLPEQRRIAAKLDTLLSCVTRARKELDRVPMLIAHHKQALLAAAFSGELTRDWRTKNVTASSDAFVAERQKQIQAIASEPGRGRDEKSALLCTDADLLSHLETIATEQPVPKQWTWAGIGQVFGTYVGATPSRKEPRYWDGTINWVSSGEVAFCRISNTAERITDQGLNNASTRIHPPGTVLLGMIGEGKTRGQAAILDIHHAFRSADPAVAREVMRRHGATLLLICPGMSETTIYASTAKRGFYAQLARGRVPVWLAPVPLPAGSPFKLWRRDE